MKIAVLSLLLVLVVCITSVIGQRGFCNRCRDPCPLCPNPNFCRFGKDTDICGCCEICLKGPREICTPRRGRIRKCTYAHYCRNVSPRFPVKICLRPRCPILNPNCLPLPLCPFGSDLDHLGCCHICKQGPFQRCGETLKCGNRLHCVRGFCQPICPPGRFTDLFDEF